MGKKIKINREITAKEAEIELYNLIHEVGDNLGWCLEMSQHLEANHKSYQLHEHIYNTIIGFEKFIADVDNRAA